MRSFAILITTWVLLPSLLAAPTHTLRPATPADLGLFAEHLPLDIPLEQIGYLENGADILNPRALTGPAGMQGLRAIGFAGEIGIPRSVPQDDFGISIGIATIAVDASGRTVHYQEFNTLAVDGRNSLTPGEKMDFCVGNLLEGQPERLGIMVFSSTYIQRYEDGAVPEVVILAITNDIPRREIDRSIMDIMAEQGRRDDFGIEPYAGPAE